MFVAECAIPLWWKELPSSERLRCVDNIGVQVVVSANHHFIYVVIIFPLHLVDEMIYGDQTSEIGQRLIVGP